MAKVKESTLQTAVLKWLAAHNIFHWRMPIGPVIHSIGQKQIWKKSPIKGFPDIAGVLKGKNRGRFFVIELKTKTNTLEPEQKKWIYNLQMAGCACAVVRSLEELEQKMIEWGEITRPKRPR